MSVWRWITVSSSQKSQNKLRVLRWTKMDSSLMTKFQMIQYRGWHSPHTIYMVLFPNNILGGHHQAIQAFHDIEGCSNSNTKHAKKCSIFPTIYNGADDTYRYCSFCNVSIVRDRGRPKSTSDCWWMTFKPWYRSANRSTRGAGVICGKGLPVRREDVIIAEREWGGISEKIVILLISIAYR